MAKKTGKIANRTGSAKKTAGKTTAAKNCKNCK